MDWARFIFSYSKGCLAGSLGRFLVGINQKVRVIFGVGRIDVAFVGEEDAVLRGVDVVDTADAHAQEAEEIGGFGPELFGVLEGGEEKHVGLDDVFADFVVCERVGHGGEVVVTVETFADGGLFAGKKFVIVALLELVLGLVVKAGERHVLDAVFDEAGEGELGDRDAGVFADVVEEHGGDELVGDIVVVNGESVTDHGERVDDVGLAVVAGLTFVPVDHIAEGAKADVHATANENAAEESDSRIDVLEATDEGGGQAGAGRLVGSGRAGWWLTGADRLGRGGALSGGVKLNDGIARTCGGRENGTEFSVFHKDTFFSKN